MNTDQVPAEDVVSKLAAAAMRCGEQALAQYLADHQAEVAVIYRNNPRQLAAATADKDNPFLYTMR